MSSVTELRPLTVDDIPALRRLIDCLNRRDTFVTRVMAAQIHRIVMQLEDTI